MNSLDRLVGNLQEQLGDSVSRDLSISDFTTYRLGGPVAAAVRVGSESDLATVARVLNDYPDTVPLLIIGRGSNLLVADSGFAGLGIILEGEFAEVVIESDQIVAAGAAVPLPVVARQSAAAGLTGLEFLVGIPGSIGGAVRMNAGGHGSEISTVLEQVRVMNMFDGSISNFAADNLNFSYRASRLTTDEVVIQARLRVRVDVVEKCRERIDEIVQWRRENQPGGANAGSTFKNPPGDSAGRLIDEAGLKGTRIGGAVVSEKHANFLQAEDGATARDVYELMNLIRKRVSEVSGVVLESELHTVGFDATEK